MKYRYLSILLLLFLYQKVSAQHKTIDYITILRNVQYLQEGDLMKKYHHHAYYFQDEQLRLHSVRTNSHKPQLEQKLSPFCQLTAFKSKKIGKPALYSLLKSNPNDSLLLVNIRLISFEDNRLKFEVIGYNCDCILSDRKLPNGLIETFRFQSLPIFMEIIAFDLIKKKWNLVSIKSD